MPQFNLLIFIQFISCKTNSILINQVEMQQKLSQNQELDSLKSQLFFLQENQPDDQTSYELLITNISYKIQKISDKIKQDFEEIDEKRDFQKTQDQLPSIQKQQQHSQSQILRNSSSSKSANHQNKNLTGMLSQDRSLQLQKEFCGEKFYKLQKQDKKRYSESVSDLLKSAKLEMSQLSRKQSTKVLQDSKLSETIDHSMQHSILKMRLARNNVVKQISQKLNIEVPLSLQTSTINPISNLSNVENLSSMQQNYNQYSMQQQSSIINQSVQQHNISQISRIENSINNNSSIFINEDSIIQNFQGFQENQQSQDHSLLQKNKKPFKLKLHEPRILPKELRENPFALKPIVKEKDLQMGIYELVNKGLIPKDTDIEPAFTRGQSIFQAKRMKIQEQKVQKYNKDSFIEGIQKYQRLAMVDPNNPSINKINNIELQQDANDLLNLSKDNDIFITDNVQDQKEKNIAMQQEESIEIQNLPISNNQSVINNLDQKTFNISSFIENNLNSKCEDSVQVNQFLKGKKQIKIHIKNGILIDNEHLKYLKNQYYEIWGNIVHNLCRLKNQCVKFRINSMLIDGNLIAYHSKDLLKTKDDILLECIMNKDIIEKIIPNKSKQAHAVMIKAWAVTKFMQFYKIIKAKKEFKQKKEKSENRKNKFQLVVFWLRYFSKKIQIQKMLKEKEKKYEKIMSDFKDNWGNIKKQERYEIHICSYSLDVFQRITMINLNERQNSQILRIFSLQDPNVNIIYVVPGNLLQDIQNYLQKLFQINHKEEYLKRIHFIIPENIDKFPQHFSLSKILYYSPISLKYIKEQIKGKIAYIVPSIPNIEDKSIGLYLEIPLLCGNIENVCKLNRRDYGRMLLKELDIPLTHGEEFIFSEGELINKLTLMIIKDVNITTYFVKLNNEINGRGIAQIQLENVKYFRKLRNSINYQFTEKRIMKIRKIIEEILPLKLVPCMDSLFNNYYEFLNRIIDTGCIIEAVTNQNIIGSSQITLKIEPNGDIQYVASFDKILIHDVITCGVTFPQKNLINLDVNKLCRTIGEKVYSRDVWGFVKIDFITFAESEKEKKTGLRTQLFQIIGIDCMLDCNTTSYFLFNFLQEGQSLINNTQFSQNKQIEDPKNLSPNSKFYESNKKQNLQPANKNMLQSDGDFDRDSNQILSNQPLQIPQYHLKEKCYTYIPMVFNQGLSKFNPKQFFQLCKNQQIAFDIQSMNGTIFILPGSLQSGMINIFCIGNDLKLSVSNMVESLHFVANKFGDQIKIHFDKKKNRQDSYYLVDVLGRVRELNKILQHTH
ncbi:IQ calmodulin-binding motif protein (macronuclear) [Tetrahymena thermophila SB210]|uniref:IQ calmodulin-binding motif protein n=1 Tax=Tetrahymena thermophila (strain SB210) TaxID=312017 RepID=I7MJL2_TETTS|nr:IQ calmodulin-binding motif protein [Tetrahymena thermophila SB210]EAR96432.2 IQ calmodulin-binding motif protein [Tetrahymena thermophila SB210]|eukprot:XP_001016677.2 IQ calmodulin-binding motif protein [Tetrahymena thermophila SB210]